jgi:putative ABC transport system ATP-binding protein
MENLMELQNVWKIYRMGEFDVPALQGINLAIKAGEFVAITGPSGCGKSTMLNMIGCMDMPTKGSVLLEGRDILAAYSQRRKISTYLHKPKGNK